MQALNAEYQSIIKSGRFEFETDEDREDCLLYPEIMSQLILLDGLTIEIIGTWVWVSGNTYAYRKELKDIGLFFAPKKLMWYYRPPHEKTRNHKPLHIDEIRAKYGSDLVEKRVKRELEEA